ncbi:hypothetical protein X768_17525 [Mesorhizobium sp. LSJC265A00]|nr:hypothetical protein X768_17525 [Mesorhizobium sp. LSJC265A00]ESZ56311.1 hypothetical protein X728_26070 [Mesorhizobium sp. L103C120A0]
MAREAIRQNYNVQFVTATLMAMLAKAHSKGSLD